MNVLDKKYVVEMPDGTRWAVPVRIIAEDRAKYYAQIDGATFKESLNGDTVPYFEEDEDEIHDWASGNMNWSEVKEHATEIGTEPQDIDWEDGWCNGEYEVIE